MNIHFIKSNEKKDILKELDKQFGIKELNYLLIRTGKDRIRAFSGTLSKEEIQELNQSVRIEGIGIYMLRQEHDFRIGFDGTQLLKEQITKNVIELTEEQYNSWIRGNDLHLKLERGTYVLKYKGIYVGCGKSNTEILFNHVPKDRRIRK